MKEEFSPLLSWFKTARRAFPWREERTPYRVLVSEMMLQQTRASVVIPYFQKWLSLFPSFKELAQASSFAVMKAWEGLGYYARARCLHQIAKEVVSKWGDHLPHHREELLSIPGIGPYTADAILCFAFNQPTAPIDGNVSRVMSRYLHLEGDVESLTLKKKIKEYLLSSPSFLSSPQLGEALIEVGATFCTPKSPHCLICPLSNRCQGHKKGIAQTLGRKREKKAATKISRGVMILQTPDQEWLLYRETKSLMQGLYQFPYFEKKKTLDQEEFTKQIYHQFRVSVSEGKELDTQRHTFTRFRCDLYPYLFITPRFIPPSGYKWCSDLSSVPFCSGHKKIVKQLQRRITSNGVCPRASLAQKRY